MPSLAKMQGSCSSRRRVRCDWAVRGACAPSSPPKHELSPKAFANAISSAAAALQIVVLRGKNAGQSVKLADDAVFRAVVGWPQRKLPPGHPAADANPSAVEALLEAIKHLVLLPNVPLEAHNEAVRRWILPKRSASIETLRALPDNAWQIAKELMLGKMLHARAIDSDTLLSLADQNRAPSRAEFAAAFGLALPRATKWRAPPEENPARSALEPRVRAANGDVHSTLSLEEALVVARAQFTNAWCSPLAYFVQNGIGHFGEAYTQEGIIALATYLSRRRAELGGERPIVEIGAGGGRLTYLLNATGLLSPAIIATDPTPQPSTFKVHKLNDEAAIRTHAPAILLCAWMSIGEDWTPRCRRAKVDEYVLIGSLGTKRDDPPSYSLSPCFDCSPYTRHVLEDVSAELLPIEAGREPQSTQADPGYSRICAVAYRRPGAVP